jgi:hypothetical protein
MKRTACFALIAALAGCGGSMSNPDAGSPDVTTAMGNFSYFVVNSLLVPADHTQDAIDLNGDGRPDNHLGDIINALSSQNLDVQTAINMSVGSGDVILLVSLQATDLTSANNVGMTVYLGNKQMNPDFTSGMGMFTVDSSQSPANFFGKIASGKFSSNNPVTTTHPVTVSIKLPLVQGVAPLALQLNGAHIQGDVSASGIMNGQLNGSIKSSDVQNNIIPAVATLLTQKVAGCVGPVDLAMASGDGGMSCSTAMTIDGIFDTGGCTDSNGTMAMAKDGIITVCEVAGNSLIMNVLAPDVQIFDSSGNYAPNKANAMKDSISLGLGFTAVGAAKFP